MSAPLPLGDEVTTPPALAPQATRLRGRYTTLIPFAQHHISQLFDVLGQPKNFPLWTYMLEGPDPFPGGRVTFEERMAFKVWPSPSPSPSPSEIFFWVVEVNAEHGEKVMTVEGGGVGASQAQGHLALWRMDLPNRSIEIGHVIFGDGIRGKRESTEVIYLLLKYVFEDLHFRRCEWKCNNLNEPSKRAAARLGLTFEGVFRQHMVLQGRNRDSAWFSMIDGEWSAAKKAFEQWLNPENFDAEQRQKVKLEAFREGGSCKD